MKQTFFSQLVSGQDNQASSKRVAFLFFVLLFSFCLLYNLFTGKAPSEALLNMLFELVIISMVAVFGDRFIDMFMLIRGQRVTTTQTIVAPSDSAVVNTTTTKEPDKK